ncbi:MAG: hypothetical protein E6J20_02735 [Chloroflexi bacterium]|nr:MAG: hypothetical protein E6J20_02735 [Chloroflexota bacterium]
MKVVFYGLMAALWVLIVGWAVYSFHTYGCFAKSCRTSHDGPGDFVLFVLAIAIMAGMLIVGRRIKN